MRSEGDRYRPTVTVLKAKNGKPTKVLISGVEYEMLPEQEKLKRDYINASRKIKQLQQLIDYLNGRLGKKEGKKHDSKRTDGTNRTA